MRFLVPLLAILIFGCGTPEKEPVKAKSKPLSKKEKEIPEYFFLNNENAPDTLKKYFQSAPSRTVKIATPVGEITVELSDKTPIHSGNFLYLIQEKNYYDSTLFYRVADNFIIQGGDADNFTISNRKYAIGEYALPMEFDNSLYHQPGALAMCRHYDNENEGLSSSFDFYIVVGDAVSELQLQTLEREKEISFSPAQRKSYLKNGGTPHLDKEHTVFGKVISGMDVVKKISKVATDSQDWPDENIFIKTEIIK